MPAALALQHTGIQSLADAKRLTRRFGVCAVGVFALNPGKQNTYSTAVIFPGGAEDVVTVEADGRWLTVEATVGGHRFAQSSVYLETAPKQRVDFLRRWLEDGEEHNLLN